MSPRYIVGRPAMLTTLLLQASLLAGPLYLDEEPPELRSVRALVVLAVSSGLEGGAGSAQEEALGRATRLRARAQAGEDFEALVRAHSNAASARNGGVLGSFAPGMLATPLDGFLFAAEPGELSQPIAVDGAVYLLERIETRAAVRQIQVAGTGEESLARARELLGELRAGADFAELARAHSDDLASAERGGDYAIFVRGPRDALLKEAAFAVPPAEVVGPIRSLYGYHLLQRAPLEELDPALAEPVFARLRAILIAHVQAVGASETVARTPDEALELAEALHARVAAGEDLAALAREWNDDPGGRERAGDLGWVYRNAPDLPRFLDRGFLLRPGELAPLVRSTAGYVILRRER